MIPPQAVQERDAEIDAMSAREVGEALIAGGHVRRSGGWRNAAIALGGTLLVAGIYAGLWYLAIR